MQFLTPKRGVGSKLRPKVFAGIADMADTRGCVTAFSLS